MQTKQALNLLGTLLFLLGVFGYIFPEWQATRFSNNENLFHVLMGVVLWMAASWDTKKRLSTLLVSGVIFLALGLFGFSLKQPDVFVNYRLLARFDEVDNYFHVLFALAFAWFWLKNRTAV